MARINGKLAGDFFMKSMIKALPDWFVVYGKNQRMVGALSIDDELNAYWG